MSEQRDALERAQARLKQLEGQGVTDDELAQLASALAREADTFEQLLRRGERRTLARERTPQEARAATFGFSLGIVAPIVVMVGYSAARFLRNQPELAALTLGAGLVLIISTLLMRTQRAVAHLFSPEWRLIRKARRLSLPLSPEGGEGRGEGK